MLRVLFQLIIRAPAPVVVFVFNIGTSSMKQIVIKALAEILRAIAAAALAAVGLSASGCAFVPVL